MPSHRVVPAQIRPTRPTIARRCAVPAPVGAAMRRSVYPGREPSVGPVRRRRVAAGPGVVRGGGRVRCGAKQIRGDLPGRGWESQPYVPGHVLEYWRHGQVKMLPRLNRDRVAVLAALIAPLAISAALVPFRDSFANTDAALVLVLVVVAIAVNGHRLAGILAALSAAFWFDFFSDRPLRTVHDYAPGRYRDDDPAARCGCERERIGGLGSPAACPCPPTCGLLGRNL